MAIRVLILHRQLVFAVTVRQALEQTGRFDAHPFTQADAAFDYLRDHPQDVALVDFTLPGRSGPKIVQQLRAIQPDLAIIITPLQENGDGLIASLNLQGMIDTPFGAREIIPLLEQAVNEIAQTPTQGSPPFVPEEGGPTQLLGTQRFSRPPADVGPLSTRPLPSDVPPSPRTRQRGEFQAPPTQPLPEATDGDYFTSPFVDTDSMPSAEQPVMTRLLSPEEQEENFRARQFGPTDRLENEPMDDDYAPTVYDAPVGDVFDQIVTGFLPDEPTAPGGPIPTRMFPPDDDDDDYLDTARLQARRYGPTDKLNTGAVGPTRSRDDEASELRRAFETGPLVEPRRTTGSLGATPTSSERPPDDEARELRRAFETSPLGDPGEAIRQRRGNTDRLGQPQEPEVDWLDQIIPRTGDLPGSRGTDPLATRNLPPDEEPPRRRGTAPRRDSAPMPPTRPAAPEPDSLPEFNSLDDVLQSFGFDPPTQAEDTPSVPLPPTDPRVTQTGTSRRQRPERDFDNLVDSMRPDEPRSRLPDRQQQMMDFIVTGGMDSVLKEIEKTRTGTLPKVTNPLPMPSTQELMPPTRDLRPPTLPEEPRRADDTAAFKRLAAEEPPMPTFEASGTVRDLMVGVSDPAFQNVLTMIQGDSSAGTSQMQTVQAEDPIQAAFDSLPEPPPEPAPRPALRLIEDFNFGFDDDESGGTSIAQAVLEGTAAFSVRPVTTGDVVDQLMQDIQNRLSFYALGIKPLPSWGMETGAFRPVSMDDIREPDFLPEQFDETGRNRLAPAAQDETFQFAGTPEVDELPQPSAIGEADFWGEAWESPATAAPVPEIAVRDEDAFLTPAEVDELPPSALDINWDVPREAPPPPLDLPEAPALVEAWEVPAPATLPAAPAAAAESWDVPVEAGIYKAADLPDLTEAAPEDPFLATVALNLTQYSLETNACSTILTQGKEVVAFAGELTPFDVEALAEEIHADWDVSVNDGARIRFVNLQHTGRDYMLYSIRTDGDLTLSMLYDAEVSLRSIRQQAGKLVTALKATPAPAQSAKRPVSMSTQRMQPVKPKADAYNTYAYLWLLRDPGGELERPVQQAVRAGLSTQLTELFWEIKNLDVHEDYIYLLANVPGETPTHDLMRDLQRRSAQIAQAQNAGIRPETLWADGYLVLAPGRALQVDEIQAFINFQRMA
jgi:DNA-binding NarL/FixJ family response regulator/REP element-mobilizing transposase RayT